MNIVIITHLWKGSVPGGTETYAVNLVEAIKNRGMNVKVIFRRGEDPNNHKIEGNKLIFSLKSFFLLRKLKPNIIHSHGTWYALLPDVLYKIVYKDVNLIFTFQSYPDNEKIPFYQKFFLGYLLNHCNLITFVSKGLQRRIEEVYEFKLENTEVTYAGVKSREISKEEINEFRKKFSIKNNSIVLLAQTFTASKVKSEGAKLLMKVVKKLRNKYPNIILILTKEGRYSNELKEFAKREGVYENIIFTGNVDEPYIPLTVCDIYTHISFGDGLPLSLLEAMSVGKPIIATPVGGIPEAIENEKNGILVKPDVDKITGKIEYLIENRELAKKLGENAEKTAEEKFSWENWDNIVDIFMEYYNL
jgi:glycosyltransferase involved in cell wall biosynthesis